MLVTGCKECKIDLCPECVEFKLCPKGHQLKYGFHYFHGYMANFQCGKCSGANIYRKGFWGCKECNYS